MKSKRTLTQCVAMKKIEGFDSERRKNIRSNFHFETHLKVMDYGAIK